MDPPLQPTATTASKLRLMCSYGGHIVPRPHTKSLCYAGGDTRIISVPTDTTATATISAFSARISAALCHPLPFILKYQLPHHDLDSLVSLSSDEDLFIFLEEHLRPSSSPTPSRIRLFLFPTKANLSTYPEATQTRPKSTQSVLQHPKTEAWFVDALKSTRIMQKGANLGLGGEGLGDANGGGDLSGGGVSGQESMVLETSSSFGSTSSSASLSNLSPIKACVEDNGANLHDSKVKLPSADSIAIASEYGAVSAISNQELVVPVTSMEKLVSSDPSESESKFIDHPSGVQMHKTVQVSGYPLSPQLVQLQHQSQFAHTGTHYIPYTSTGVLPVPSYYPMYYPLLPQQQQQLHYQPNQPYPIYVLPIEQTRPHNLPMQCALVDSKTTVSTLPRMHLNSPMPELASQVYRMTPTANALVHVPYNEIQQQTAGLSQMQHQPQSTCVGSRETANYGNEQDDDPACAQIYKSQPPPPTLPSQYQTMTKATRVLLSEALSHFHTDNIKQQIRTSQPQ